MPDVPDGRSGPVAGSTPDGRFAPVAEHLAPLVDRFEAAGHRLYLVGGAVRDVLAGRGVDVDHDLTTDARPEETKRLLGDWVDDLWTQGERFGTIGARFGDVATEITTHRAEAYDLGSRKPSVRFGSRIEADLSRRDFTVNSMAVALPDLTLIDPFGGRADLLDRKVLRTPASPAASFVDDPLRMLRAARFVTRFELTPVPELVAEARRLGSRLAIVSAERVLDELGRLLAAPDPRPGLDLLVDTGLLERVLPETGGPEARDRVAAAPAEDLAGRLALLLAGVPSRRVADRLRALRASRHLRDDVVALAAALTDVGTGGPWTPVRVRELSDRLGDRLDRFAPLVAAHDPGSGRELADAVAARRRHEDLDGLSLPVDGRDVAGWLGVEPGPAVGAALAELHRFRVIEGPLSPARAEEIVRRSARHVDEA